MVIEIGRLSNSGSIALSPFRGRGGSAAFVPRAIPSDVTAPTERMDERRQKPGRTPSDEVRDEEDRGRGRCPRAGRERLEVTNARVVLATRVDPGIAGYGTFTNETNEPATVVGLDCPAFDRVEMRETIAIGDVTVLRRMDALTVLPDESVEFAPGGRRLMMTGPRLPLEPEQLLGITVIFSSGRRRVVPFRIVAGARPRGRLAR